MPSVTSSTSIRRSREEVFDFIDDLANHAQFVDHFLLELQVTSASGRGVGATARMRAKGAGRHPWVEITTVESVRPQRTVEHGRGGKHLRRRTTGTYELRDAGEGVTEVTFTNELEPSGIGEWLGVPFSLLYLRRGNDRALARLKALLER